MGDDSTHLQPQASKFFVPFHIPRRQAVLLPVGFLFLLSGIELRQHFRVAFRVMGCDSRVPPIQLTTGSTPADTSLTGISPVGQRLVPARPMSCPAAPLPPAPRG